MIAKTYRHLYQYCVEQMTALGRSNSENEARWLLEAFTGRHFMFLLSKEVDRDIEIRCSDALRELAAGRPFQYVVGTQSFCGLDLLVDERVLIPRRETEELVATAVNWAQDRANLRILDLCTGSGAIAVALAKQLPNAEVDAVDISADALAVAKENARRHDVNVRFYRGDLLQALPETTEPYDIITANPPYLSHEELIEADVSIQREPRLALDGGKNGLLYVEEILRHVADHMRTPGLLVMEIGETQGPAVLNMARDCGWKQSTIQGDLSNKDRFLVAHV